VRVARLVSLKHKNNTSGSKTASPPFGFAGQPVKNPSADQESASVFSGPDVFGAFYPTASRRRGVVPRAGHASAGEYRA
jgi:hypothetical protein